MKVLLLSCLTGDGHNSAARAVQNELDMRGIYNEIADPVSFRSEKAKRVVSSAYNNMIRKTPKTFGAVYKAGKLYDSTGLTSPVYWANSMYARRLNNYIAENGFDAVVCTHLFGMEAMTAIKKKCGGSVPCYGILTDYTNIPFLCETALDGYFVPHENIKEQLCKRGIPKESVFCTGIPVAAKFNKHYEKKQAREMLDMVPDKKVFLIMTGGVGCENMLALCDEFVNLNDENTVAYVLVGRNADMKNRIDEKYRACGRVYSVPFTDQVNVYMNAADVLLSKSGGLSSTEAAVANVPFVCVKPIPGCETENARFFASKGMALYADSYKQAAENAYALVNNTEKSEQMIASQRLNINPYAARDIVDLIMR